MPIPQDTYDVGYAPRSVKKARQFWQLIPSSATLTIRDDKITLRTTPKNEEPQLIFDLPVTAIKKATFAPVKYAVILSIRTTDVGDYNIQFSGGMTRYYREAKEVRNKLKSLGVSTTNLVPGPILGFIIAVLLLLVGLYFLN